MGVGRNLSYRRSKFLEVKGFNNFTKITGGDDDLFVNQHARKRNTAVCVDDDSIVTSFPKTTFASFFNQKIRHLSVGKYYRFGHRVLARSLYAILDLDMVCGDTIGNFISAEICCSWSITVQNNYCCTDIEYCL